MMRSVSVVMSPMDGVFSIRNTSTYVVLVLNQETPSTWAVTTGTVPNALAPAAELLVL